MTHGSKGKINGDPALLTRMIVSACCDQEELSSRMEENELYSILTFSLKSLFGECHPHYAIEIKRVNPLLAGLPEKITVEEKRISLFQIVCSTASASAIRAALTLCELPHYYTASGNQPLLFRFDVLSLGTCHEE
jgi:hypothetical protein